MNLNGNWNGNWNWNWNVSFEYKKVRLREFKKGVLD